LNDTMGAGPGGRFSRCPFRLCPGPASPAAAVKRTQEREATVTLRPGSGQAREQGWWGRRERMSCRLPAVNEELMATYGARASEWTDLGGEEDHPAEERDRLLSLPPIFPFRDALTAGGVLLLASKA
jgi:hypothetical protein